MVSILFIYIHSDFFSNRDQTFTLYQLVYRTREYIFISYFYNDFIAVSCNGQPEWCYPDSDWPLRSLRPLRCLQGGWCWLITSCAAVAAAGLA